MMKANEYLYGWQATAPETISPTVWQKMYDVYVADEYKLGMEKFFDKSNPAARQQIVARLLEVDRQGTYQFTAADRQRLVLEYVRLVSRNGVACSANVCGNRKLQQSVLAAAKQMANDPASANAVREFERQFREALRPQPKPQMTTSHQSLKRAKRTTLADLFNLPTFRLEDITGRTQRFVAEHLLEVVMAILASALLGVASALWRRFRPSSPPTVLAIEE